MITIDNVNGWGGDDATAASYYNLWFSKPVPQDALERARLEWVPVMWNAYIEHADHIKDMSHAMNTVAAPDPDGPDKYLLFSQVGNDICIAISFTLYARDATTLRMDYAVPFPAGWNAMQLQSGGEQEGAEKRLLNAATELLLCGLTKLLLPFLPHVDRLVQPGFDDRFGFGSDVFHQALQFPTKTWDGSYPSDKLNFTKPIERFPGGGIFKMSGQTLRYFSEKWFARKREQRARNELAQLRQTQSNLWIPRLAKDIDRMLGAGSYSTSITLTFIPHTSTHFAYTETFYTHESEPALRFVIMMTIYDQHQNVVRNDFDARSLHIDYITIMAQGLLAEARNAAKLAQGYQLAAIPERPKVTALLEWAMCRMLDMYPTISAVTVETASKGSVEAVRAVWRKKGYPHIWPEDLHLSTYRRAHKLQIPQMCNDALISSFHIPSLRCVGCHNAGKLKHCGACRGVVYCGAQCQAAHWPTHQKTCSYHSTQL